MTRDHGNFILRMVREYPDSTGYSEAQINKALEATGDLKPTYAKREAKLKLPKKSPMRWQRDALSFEGH